MILLPMAVGSWGSNDFRSVLARELERLGTDDLPLQRGMSGSSQVVDGGLKVMIISASERGDHIHVRAGLFYSGVIGGCSCADDPTPINENPEYCEIDVVLDRTTAEAVISLCSD